MSVLEGFGDLWTMPADARCVTTNGATRQDNHAIMGRGCAQQARDQFPGIDARLGRLLVAEGNHVHWLGRWGPQNLSLFSFPVKHTWQDQADLELIERSAHELMEVLDGKNRWFKVLPPDGIVLLPRPGVGNGRRSWVEVRKVIAPILDDRVLVITNEP